MLKGVKALKRADVRVGDVSCLPSLSVGSLIPFSRPRRGGINAPIPNGYRIHNTDRPPILVSQKSTDIREFNLRVATCTPDTFAVVPSFISVYPGAR